jgi:DNA-binding MarR family transcriptional regulator
VREGVLAVLQEHGSLAVEQIAAFVGRDVSALNPVVASLRDEGLIRAVAVTNFEGHTGVAVAYWRLTDSGQDEFARLRARR